MQIVGDGDPHRVENEVDSLSTGKLGRGDEVGIARHQDDLVRLLLVRDRCDIEPDLHVDAFWGRVVHEVTVGERVEFALTIDQLLKGTRSEPPAEPIFEVAQPENNLAQARQFLVKARAEDGIRRLTKVERLA
jgi:hypothetical protein